MLVESTAAGMQQSQRLELLSELVRVHDHHIFVFMGYNINDIDRADLLQWYLIEPEHTVNLDYTLDPLVLPSY
eukprot:204121-Amorphochlora_amoeboformis.AAC.1